jgi:hypothetical protein
MTTKDDCVEARGFPARPRGRRRPRSPGSEIDDEGRPRRRGRLREAAGIFLIVLVVVVVLGPLVVKSTTKDDHDDDWDRRYSRSFFPSSQ